MNEKLVCTKNIRKFKDGEIYSFFIEEDFNSIFIFYNSNDSHFLNKHGISISDLYDQRWGSEIGCRFKMNEKPNTSDSVYMHWLEDYKPC